jgi:hypothetical protein
VTATEDDVPTGRIVDKDAKRFCYDQSAGAAASRIMAGDTLNLVVGSFLAVTNIDDTKQRLIYIEVLDKTS